MKITKHHIVGLIIIILGLLIGLGSWKFERWLNWKLDYGAKVNRRIETLEQRITALERGHVIEKGIEVCRKKDCCICNK